MAQKAYRQGAKAHQEEDLHRRTDGEKQERKTASSRALQGGEECQGNGRREKETGEEENSLPR